MSTPDAKKEFLLFALQRFMSLDEEKEIEIHWADDKAQFEAMFPHCEALNNVTGEDRETLWLLDVWWVDLKHWWPSSELLNTSELFLHLKISLRAVP